MLTSASSQQEQDRIKLKIGEARALAVRVFETTGYTEEEATIIADHLIDAELSGYGYSGLAKILNIVENPRNQRQRRPVSVVKETEVSALVDGGNNVGMLSVYRATEIVIRKAETRGIAIVGVYDSFNSGRSAYYLEMIARAGLVGIHLVGASPQVAAPGGTKAVLGTNPIGFGIPTMDGVMVFDMGTASIAGSDLALKSRLGEILPDGVAIDSSGNPTRDPKVARSGGLLPFGGYKGFGLSLCLQAIALLAAAELGSDKNYGFLMIAIAPGLFVPLDQFKHEVSKLLSRVKATKPDHAGAEEIRIPSERAYRERARRLSEGTIVIEKKIYEALISY